MKIKSFGLCKVLLLDKTARPALFYSLSSQPDVFHGVSSTFLLLTQKYMPFLIQRQLNILLGDQNTSGLAIFSQHFSQRNIFISPCVYCWLLAIGLVHTPPACNPSPPISITGNNCSNTFLFSALLFSSVGTDAIGI